MFKKLKERNKFRRRRKVEKKLRKYFDEYVKIAENDAKSMTEGELHHIEDIAHYCYIDATRIEIIADLQERRRFGSKCRYVDDLINKGVNHGKKR